MLAHGARIGRMLPALVALLALASLAPGCRCTGGGQGDSCDTNADCDTGLVCDPATSTCQPAPGADGGTDASTDAGPGPTDSGPGDSGAGDSGTASTDAASSTDAAGACGNMITEGLEECDDGNTSDDDFCNTDCTFACGDGTVNLVELCDTAIPAGSPGACPTTCDDGDACTADSLNGTECTSECVAGPITALVSGDGCCPPGGNETNDGDCMPACDNGVIETGETCDPSSSCPTSCDDLNACTVDALSGDPLTCDAACTNTSILTCTAGDGCCPSGCTDVTDTDCSPTCGNGTIDPGETCDPSATCPTTCNDGNACTNDVLTGSAMTCNVACSNAPITAFTSGDGCCPPGGNNNLDGDCPVVCGNGALESGETCDDGNTTGGDGCDAVCQSEGPPPTVFRPSDLDLREPHVYVDVPFFGCNDITDMGILGNPSVNAQLQTAVQTDADADGDLDLSFLIIFRPLDQTVPLTLGAMDFTTGDCTPPLAGTTCDIAPMAMLRPSTFTNLGTGTCLDTIAGTTYGPYAPNATPATAMGTNACFYVEPIDLPLTLAGAMFTLHEAQLGARYVGSPATTLSNGLMRGFLTEADADVATLDPTLPLVGGNPLSSVLPGGTGNCAGHSDIDMGPDGAGGTTTGWWFYLNFPADLVTYVGP